MKKVEAFLAILFLLILPVIIPSAFAQHIKSVRKTISVAEFDRKLKTTKHPQLIDVRTPEEYASGHLAGAVNINVDDSACIVQFGKLNRGKAVFIYCLAGKRSEKAADILQKIGFKEIYNMKGGITEWQNTGKSVVKDVQLLK